MISSSSNILILSLNNIAIQAGKIIMRYYKNLQEVSLKDDQSPLTEADLASNSFIMKELKNIDRSVPILN